MEKKRKRRIVLLIVLVLIITYIGYRYYAYSYRYGTEPETDLVNTSTEPLLTEEQLIKNLGKYEDLSTLNVNNLSQTSYVIPGLL